MEELVKQLNAAARAYYQESREIMSNLEYDRLYDELRLLEKETGTVLAGSPTAQVGYEVLSELPKEHHPSPMLSLDKTKSVEDLQEFLGEQQGILSWKMDGLTVVLTYDGGELAKAVTRGNGEVGEVVTSNARAFENLPVRIPHTGRLVLRGEALIGYQDFRKMNEEIQELDAKYKNPRNLCAGSVRQLNSQVTASRHVRFMAFALVEAEEVDFENSRAKQFEWLKGQGFGVVEYEKVNRDTVAEAVERFAGKIRDNDLPSDGLVLLLEDIAYGESLGRTAKFPRNAIAFKWADEQAQTSLSYIEWSPSRTGLINPVAVFEPVQLEGTTVSRASVHNLSVMEALELGEGDRITVYKANMIIPQIGENLTRSGKITIPRHCPVCGGDTEVRDTGEVRTLYCTNPECQAKKIKSFALFVSRAAMNVDGMSEATLEKFIARGFIHEFADLFRLERYRDEIVELEGFGEKSYENLIASAKKASHTTLPRLIYSLGIPGIGLANARMLCRAFGGDLDRLMRANQEELTEVDGIGGVLAEAWTGYFASEKNRESLENLLKELIIEQEQAPAEEQIFAGKTFVITGAVEHFANRNEMKAYLEARGGKVTGTVSAKTSYLVNNDIASQSSKNKKAKDLGIPIITEETVLSGKLPDGEEETDAH